MTRIGVTSMKDSSGAAPLVVKACFSTVLESKRMPPQKTKASLEFRLTNIVANQRPVDTR